MGSARKIIVTVIILAAVIGLRVYNSLDEKSTTKNNDGLASLESGDIETGIRQLQEASQDAFTDEAKLATLINLGYAYSSEGQYDQALESFKEALTHTSEDSFDYYLVSGEIALIEGNPDLAEITYEKAYQLKPNDYQINGALGWFYLDLDEFAPEHTDYKKALPYMEKAYDVADDEFSRNAAKQNLAVAHFFNDNYGQVIDCLLYISPSPRDRTRSRMPSSA